MLDKNNEEYHKTCSQGRSNVYTRLNRKKKEARYPSVGQRLSVSENAHRPSCIQAGRIAGFLYRYTAPSIIIRCALNKPITYQQA